jgi:DNA-binding winged helix-turn-helix (wHTH) protein
MWALTANITRLIYYSGSRDVSTNGKVIMFYTIGSFTLDSKKEILYLTQSKIVVSKNVRYAQLFLCLIKGYPEAVSKMELTEKLWPDSEVSPASLSTLISNLRQELADHDKEREYIKTIHTKGFKLAVEAIPIETFPQNPISTNDNSAELPEPKNPDQFSDDNKKIGGFPKPKKLFAAGGLATGLLIILVVFQILLKPTHTQEGELFPGKIIEIPVNKDWSVTSPGSIETTSDGVVIKADSDESFFVSTELKQAAFFQGATFSVDMEVNQPFVDRDGDLRFYFQTHLDGWPGEWDCGPPNKMLKSLSFKHDCVIDEDGSFTNVLENESVNLGVKIDRLRADGVVKIKSAKLKLLPSISMQKGWSVRENIPVKIDRGVSYKPKLITHQLSTIIKGPQNIKGSKLAFSMQVNESNKKSNMTLHFFVMDKKDKWHECFAYLGDYESDVFTKVCDFKHAGDIFVLEPGEKVEVGVRPSVSVNFVDVKIVGITVME